MKSGLLALLLVTVFAAVLILVNCSKDQKSEPASQASSEIMYVCPMHPEVVSKEPGLCPKCNMQLVHKDSLSEGGIEPMADTTKQIYSCPMHPEVTSDRPGVCPKCNMNLVLKEVAAPDTTSSQNH